MRSKKAELNDYVRMIGNLKLSLKTKKIEYKELAAGIGLSESGVKKIFSGTDCSFQRIAQICKFAGISLSEIIEDHSVSDVSFSEKHQEEFLREPKLFLFYWLLVYERLSLDKAQMELKLSKAEAFRLTRRLDMLGLIKLLPNDRVRVPSVKAVRWMGGGKFLHKLYHDWSNNLVNSISKLVELPNELFIIRYLPMDEQLFSEFKRALKSVEDEFVRRSIHEMKVRHNELKHVRWLVAADDRSFVTGRPKT